MTPSLPVWALPEKKQQAILAEFGRAGQTWIEAYPELIEFCLARWGLEIEAVASAGLPINQILLGRDRDGRSVALKTGCPHPEQRTEMIAYQCLDPTGMARVLAVDKSRGVLLLERLRPGTTFRDSTERRVLLPPVHAQVPGPVTAVAAGLPTFRQWLELAVAEYRKRPADPFGYGTHFERALRLFDAIEQEAASMAVIHGDLHHENILLDDTRGWTVVDPKGVIAPPAMEYGRFLHNFLQDEIDGIESLRDARIADLVALLEGRWQRAAATSGLAAGLLARVTYVDVVLSVGWTLNAAGDGEPELPLQNGLTLVRAVSKALANL